MTTRRSFSWIVPAVLIGAVAAVAVLAVALSDGGVDAPPMPTDATVLVEGERLPPFTDPGDDPAVGMRAPIVRGSDFEGRPVAIEPDGRPKVLLFLAHWCPHCQAEVPQVQAWVDAGGLPDGVDLIAVVTSYDPSRPNWPPTEWLAREGWSSPVLVDDPGGSVATAYGLTGFPYWVFTDGDLTVRARTAGEVPIDSLELIVAALVEGS